MEQLLQKNQQQLIKSKKLKIGVEWDYREQSKVDLDCQCLLIDELGQIQDAIYYNQLQSYCKGVSHSGDIQKGEKEGFDEEIDIDIIKLPNDCRYLAFLICSYSGESFEKVESASASILCDGKVVCSIHIGSLGNVQSLLLGFLYQNYDETWSLYNCSATGSGKNFMENEDLIKENLQLIGFDPAIMHETQNWKVGSGKSFQMQKNQIIMLPDKCCELKFCLGWDTQCDIDASIICSEQNDYCLGNTCYFGLKKVHGFMHQGDNLTGEGSGDDETIYINLNKIPQRISYFYATITIFTQNKFFNSVKGAYARVLIDGQEFCRINLSNCDEELNGNIVCKFKRQQSNWSIQSLDFFTNNTKRPEHLFPILKQIDQNNYKNIKIIESPKNYLIHILKGVNLGSFDSNGLSDPYVKVKIGKKKLFKTSIINCSLNPEWNQSFTATLSKNDVIDFKLYDYDFMVSDDFMGMAQLKVFQIKLNDIINLELYNKNMVKEEIYKGHIVLKIELLK